MKNCSCDNMACELMRAAEVQKIHEAGYGYAMALVETLKEAVENGEYAKDDVLGLMFATSNHINALIAHMTYREGQRKGPQGDVAACGGDDEAMTH